LANRKLDCDFLIDQTYKRLEIEYIPYVPAHCKILVGSKYALLRSEFEDLRRLALIKRNKSHKIKNILVSMGGVDRHNKTKIVMDVLHDIEWKEKILVNVVVGTQSKNIDINNSNNIRVLLYKNVLNMAKLMLDADLSIGCAGTTSWERCCLSLPSLVTASVDNQQVILKTLEKFGIIKVWSDKATLKRQIKKIITNDQEWHCMKLKSYNVCDGRGADRVMDELNDVYG
jgi:spore coat polysaccharide biosynthesis predicted glycosyltransferase SpsG